MPTTRKQKKARKSRGVEMSPDIENLDMMLGGSHLEREESEDDNSSRRSNSPNLITHENNEENHYTNSREKRSSNSAENGHNSAGTDSSADFDRLSGELNLRISREMDDMINNVSAQIQRAINNAISSPVLTQIQNALQAGPGPLTQKDGTSRLRDRNDNPNTIRVRKLGAVLEVSQSVSVYVTKIQITLTTLGEIWRLPLWPSKHH